MSVPTLYRKRLIPSECVCLKDDEILLYNDDVIVTRWKVLHPRKDINHGLSCFFLKEGYKVSRFFDHDSKLIYHYIDIITSDYEEATNSLVVTDLLADIIIFPDGFVRVVDLDEISEALHHNLITTEDVCTIMNTVDRLLKIIYDGRLDELCRFLDEYAN